METLLNQRHAFLFQGVGVMYHPYLDHLDSSQRERLTQLNAVIQREIGMDLEGYLFQSSQNGFDQLLYDWVAVYAIDYILYDTYLSLRIKPALFLGYSMGLIIAMACGKAISFETGLHLLIMSYEYGKRASRQNETMAMIAGLTCDDIEQLIQDHDLADEVHIASENNEFCVIIAGSTNGVHELMIIAEQEGAFKVKGIDAPFAYHSKYAEIGIETYVEFVERIDIYHCELPIVSSFDQHILQSPSELREELIRNVKERMYWKHSIQKLGDMGIHTSVEVTLKESVSKFSKVINPEAQCYTYKKIWKLTSAVQAEKRTLRAVVSSKKHLPVPRVLDRSALAEAA